MSTSNEKWPEVFQSPKVASITDACVYTCQQFSDKICAAIVYIVFKF